MPRIVAGRAGGQRLTVPGRGTRPTSDMAREGMFSTLAGLLDLDGVRVLDLYAGSGALGLEAWSRGAAEVVLVESAAAALRAARANVSVLGAEGAVVVRAEPAERAVVNLAGRGFDLLLADPPYALSAEQLAGVLGGAIGSGLLGAGALVVVERAARDAWVWPLGIEGLRMRRYGDAALWYGRLV